MLAVRNSLKSASLVASATGLTALDQTAAAFTWSAWIRQYYNNGSTYLWAHSDGGNAGGPTPPRNGISVFINARRSISLNVWDASAASVATPDGFMPIGRWVHIAFLYDGAMCYVILNGRVVMSGAMTKAPTISGTRTTALGVAAGAAGAGMLCDLWDIRVFPALALPIGSATRLWDPTFNPPGCKQRLFYQRPFRALGTGAVTILDESGNGNSLTSSATLLECAAIDPPNWRRILAPSRRIAKTATGTADFSRVIKQFFL